MADRRRITRRTALGIVAAGGLLTASETLGVTNVTGSRGVSVNTATGPDALLGIDAQDDIDVLRGDDGNVEVAELINNFDQKLDVVEVSVARIVNDGGEEVDTGVLTADADPRFDVYPGESSSAEVACAEAENEGECEVTFAVDATGSSVSVTEASFVVSIDIRCQRGTLEPTESGLQNVFVSDLEDGSPEQNQTIAFQLTEDLPQTESVEIVLDGVTGGNRIDYSDSTYETEAPGTVIGDREGRDIVITFTTIYPIDAGETVEITAAGVDTTGGNADGTYDAFFQRSEFDADEETTFEVA